MKRSVTAVNGVEIPQIGFGIYKIKQGAGEDFDKTILAAIQAGYRHFDTARIYGNEAALGSAIDRSLIPREQFFLTSKAWTTELGYTRTRKAFEQSCRKLGTNVLDMYLIHFAGPDYVEAWKAIEELYEEGRIRVIGVANFEIEHLERLMQQAQIPPMLNQIETHPEFQQSPLRAYMERHHILHEAWAPLGQGSRTLLENKELTAIAAAHDCTTAQIILAWHLHRGTIVIPKSSNPVRMRENIQSVNIVLTPGELERIAQLDTKTRYSANPTGFQIHPLFVQTMKWFVR